LPHSVYQLVRGKSTERDPPKAESDERPAKGTETILLAEDHVGLRELAQEILEALGYHVVVATNGKEAVELFKTTPGQIDLAILDVVMPGLSGPDVYLEMSAIRPSLAVVFATGYTAEAASLTSLVKKGATVLQKPYSAKTLSQAIRGALERTDSSVLL
jgi:two-component system, cell cycle sensor histidine kinase and response regulator CckA